MRSSLLAWVVATALVSNMVGCRTVTEGIEVDIAYETPPTPQALLTNLENRVWLDRALIALGPVELVECDNFARHLLGLFTLGRARAHIPDTPTQLGVPLVVDLIESSGFGYVIGTIRPPPGRYCGVRVVGTPADPDAVGLKNNAEMLESSVFLSGEFEDATTRARHAFAVTIREPLIRELRFDEPLVFDGPRSVSVSVRIDHIRWFDGIDIADFAPLEAEAVQRKLSDNIRTSMAAQSQ